MGLENKGREEIKKSILDEVDPKRKAARKKQQRKDGIIAIIEFIGIIAVVIILFFVLFGQSSVDGDSMYPTLHDGNKVIYSRFGSDYQRGDIIAIKMDSGADYVKRIVGIPGDTINIMDGKVYVNGEEYVASEFWGATEATNDKVSYPIKLSDDEYFVLGDNRENSNDSRNFGPIDKKQIKGVIKYMYGKVK